MKKIAKLSLVAAVAVAGLTSANAQSLENAIKNVDVSGSIRYRGENKKTEGGSNIQLNDYDAEMVLKSKINDRMTAVVKLDVAGDVYGTSNGDGKATTTDVGDAKPSVNLEDVYFGYNAGSLTLTAGKQNIPGPLTDGAQGTGAVVMAPMGSVTLAGAAFTSQSINNWSNVAAVAAIGKAASVSYQAWLVKVQGAEDMYMNVNGSAKVGPAGIAAAYTTGQTDESLMKVAISGKLGMINAKFSYAAQGKAGSGTIDGGAETPADFLVWQTNFYNKTDSTAMALDVNTNVTAKTNVRVAYVTGEVNSNQDITEMIAQVGYKVSKNLNTYARLSQYEQGTTETNRGRIEVNYSF